jgi:hypothetical protein
VPFLWREATEPSSDTGILIDFGFKNWSQRDASRTRDRVFERISALLGHNDAQSGSFATSCDMF